MGVIYIFLKEFMNLRSNSKEKWGDRVLQEIMGFCRENIEFVDATSGAHLKLGALQLSVNLWAAFKKKVNDMIV